MTNQIHQYNTYISTIQSHLDITGEGCEVAHHISSHLFSISSCLINTFCKIIDYFSRNQFCQPNSLTEDNFPKQELPYKKHQKTPKTNSHISAELLLNDSVFSMHLYLNQLCISWSSGNHQIIAPCSFYPQKNQCRICPKMIWCVKKPPAVSGVNSKPQRLFCHCTILLSHGLLLPGDVVENPICKAPWYVNFMLLVFLVRHFLSRQA